MSGYSPVNEEYHKVKTLGRFPTGLVLEPENLDFILLNNIYRRSLSLITAHNSGNEIILQATSSGNLKVAQAGSGLEIYSVASGNAPDAFSALHQIDYSSKYSSWIIVGETNDFKIRWKDANGAWLASMYFQVGTYQFDFESTTLQIANRTAASVCVYQMIGMG